MNNRNSRKMIHQISLLIVQKTLNSLKPLPTIIIKRRDKSCLYIVIKQFYVCKFETSENLSKIPFNIPGTLIRSLSVGSCFNSRLLHHETFTVHLFLFGP